MKPISQQGISASDLARNLAAPKVAKSDVEGEKAKADPTQPVVQKRGGRDCQPGRTGQCRAHCDDQDRNCRRSLSCGSGKDCTADDRARPGQRAGLMASLNISEFETAQRNLVAALDGHSADEILICCEELQQASEVLRGKKPGCRYSASRKTRSARWKSSILPRGTGSGFLHDMCRARMFMIANQSDSQTYSPL